MDDQKWYRGWKNIVTIISFLLPIWPLPLLVMWILAGWQKRVKIVISFIYLPIAVIILARMVPPIVNDLESATNVQILASRINLLMIGLTLFVGVALSLMHKKIGKTLSDIWVPVIVVVLTIFSIMVFFMIQGILAQHRALGL